jgi:hypothetical protein
MISIKKYRITISLCGGVALKFEIKLKTGEHDGIVKLTNRINELTNYPRRPTIQIKETIDQ